MNANEKTTNELMFIFAISPFQNKNLQFDM